MNIGWAQYIVTGGYRYRPQIRPPFQMKIAASRAMSAMMAVRIPIRIAVNVRRSDGLPTYTSVGISSLLTGESCGMR